MNLGYILGYYIPSYYYTRKRIFVKRSMASGYKSKTTQTCCLYHLAPAGSGDPAGAECDSPKVLNYTHGIWCGWDCLQFGLIIV